MFNAENAELYHIFGTYFAFELDIFLLFAYNSPIGGEAHETNDYGRPAEMEE